MGSGKDANESPRFALPPTRQPRGQGAQTGGLGACIYLAVKGGTPSVGWPGEQLVGQTVRWVCWLSYRHPGRSGQLGSTLARGPCVGSGVERDRRHLRRTQGNKYGLDAGWGSKGRPETPALRPLGSHQPPPLPHSPLVHSSMHLSVGKRRCRSVCHRGPPGPLHCPQAAPAAARRGGFFSRGADNVGRCLGEKPEKTWGSPVLRKRQVRPSHLLGQPGLLTIYLMIPGSPSALEGWWLSEWPGWSPLPRPDYLKTKKPPKPMVRKPQGEGGGGPCRR